MLDNPASRPHLTRQAFVTEALVGDVSITALTHATILLISLALALFIAWTAVTPVEEMAHASGEIVPVGSVQSIEHLEGGIVEDLMVREGDWVEAGQPLIRLGSAAALAERDQLSARQRQLQAQAERLSAFVENRPARFDTLGVAPETVEEQLRILAAQIDARDQQEKVLLDQITDLQGQLATVERRRAAASFTRDLVGRKEAIRGQLVERGLNSTVQLIETQRERSASESDLLQIQGNAASLRDTIFQTRSRIAELHGRLRQDALERLGKVSADLAEVREQIKALDDRVSRLVIVAPTAGIVQELAIKTIGGVIQPGALVARIVPVKDDLRAEVRVSPKDIGFIKVGQKAKIKVSAFDYSRYGRIDGEVIKISPSTFLDKDKQPYYLTKIRMFRNYVGSDGLRIIPGMLIDSDIVTGQKTVFEYLLKPIFVNLDGILSER